MKGESSPRHSRSRRPASDAVPARRGGTARPVRSRAAHHLVPGQLRATGAGTVLRCLVLVPGPDWVAVDLESGALLRAPADPPPSPEDVDGGAGEDPVEDRRSKAGNGAAPWPERSLDAVELTLGADLEPVDPARPEAIVLARPPARVGEMRKRATRQLLQQLVTKASDRPLLGTLGPSISYGDLDGTRPSVVIVAPEARPRFGVGPSGPWCQFALGGRRHTMPCAEHASPDATATGHGARLLVVALGAPQRGQVPKVVLGTLPLARRGR